MKLGLVARAEDRGLGIQTWEIARALQPERILIVEMPPDQVELLSPHYDRYAELASSSVVVVRKDAMGDRAVIGPWLDGLDVVYSAEAFYSDGFVAAARDMRVQTVLHANPEFYDYRPGDGRPRPSAVWTATAWMHGHARLGHPRVVPMPCPIDRWPTPREPGAPVRFLHVAGTMAAADRAGTRSLLAAVRKVTAPMRLTLCTQRRTAPRPGRVPRHVEYRSHLGNRRDYWSLYDDADVLVLPRRFGGLSLPTIEAMGAGLAVVMTDAPPNRMWPIVPVAADPGAAIPTQLHAETPTVTANAAALARVMDRLATDGDELRGAMTRSREWAEANSWDALADTWRSAFAEVCGR